MAEKEIFLGGSTSILKVEFDERLKYKNLINYPGMIDTLYDKHAYGLINEVFEPVYPVGDPAVFATFPTFAPDIQCLGFVATAFEIFRAAYLERINNTDRNAPVFLDGVVPVAGHESFERLYGDYIIYNSAKYSSFLQNDKQINDYRCYLTALKETLSKNLRNFPVTRSGFLLSRHNNVRSSGMVLELAKLDYNRDFEKGQIVQSRDFECFVDYAASSGFYVDKFNPWRLYANLDHPSIHSILRRGQASESDEPHTRQQAKNVLNSIYRLKSHEDDLYDLQDFVIKTYNDMKKVVPFYVRSVYNSQNAKTKEENVFRPEIEMLSAEEWLELLLFVRLMELDIYTDTSFEKSKTSVLQINQIYGLKEAIGKIGQISSQIIKEKYEKREDNTAT
jgi:hypothetical protein